MLHHLITVYLFLITICLSAAEPVDPNQIFKPTQTINPSPILPVTFLKDQLYSVI